jgi:hypothetical protein
MSTTPFRLSPSLSLPLAAATETFAILGRRGSGKTHTAVVLAEELLKQGLQVVVIDPLDVWWGLRAGKTAKTSGLPIYVVGGERGDLPLHASQGAVLADAVVAHGMSVVLSLRHLSKTDQRRFVGDFCERLYDLKGKHGARTSLHVFIDEADAFVPQRLVPGSERAFGAVDTMVRRGRSSGLATTLISQRPQVINKDVLSQTEVLVSHQLTSPQDRKALLAWIEANDSEDRASAFMASLASLPRGTAWFWSPGLLDIFTRVAVRDRDTFDSSSTPKPGVAAAQASALRPVDLNALQHSLAESLEKAAANDPATLKKRIRDLEQEIAKRSPTAPVQVERVDVPAVSAQTMADLRDWALDLRSMVTSLTGEVDKVLQALDLVARASATRPAPTRQATTTVQAQPRVVPAPRSTAIVAGTLPSGHRKILAVLAQFPAGRTKVQVALLTGYAHNGGGFNNYLSALRKAGHLTGAGDALQITSEGRAALGDDWTPLPTDPLALLAHWSEELSKAERLVLQALVTMAPRGMTKEQIAHVTGYEANGGGFNNALSRLRTLELITGRGELRAAEVFSA